MDWVEAECERRFAEMEAGGRTLSVVEKLRIKRKMHKEMAGAENLIGTEVEEDREAARAHGQAKALKAAGTVPEKIFLRLGELPKGPSRSVLGYYEDGISVFAGAKTVEGHYIVKLSNKWLRSSLARFCATEDRIAYFVTGKVEGRGSDGEPLLRELRSVEPVPTEATVVAEPSSLALEEWNRRRLEEVLEDTGGRS